MAVVPYVPITPGAMNGPDRQEMPLETTFPRLLLEHARARPAAPALREKEYGIWHTTTWRALADEVRALACGLAEAGLGKGQHLVVVGDNRPRLYACMLAAQSLGGIPVPLYQDAVGAEMVFPINNPAVPIEFFRLRHP